MLMNRDDLRALRNLIEEARRILATTKLPDGRAERARELLTSAVALADQLIAKPPAGAAALGKRGGMRTAERGPEYFRKIAAMRKTKGGGRPPKSE
jgi:hypothetical protein